MGNAVSVICSFRHAYGFLSNFSPAVVEYAAATYPTVEHAYQAAKVSSPRLREQIRTASSAGLAKQLARGKHKPDWHERKLYIMSELVLQKFTRHLTLHAQLLRTGSAQLIEGNTWGDQYWGAVRVDNQWVGQNQLGNLLMAVRAGLQAGHNLEQLQVNLTQRAADILGHALEA